jgi:hypothetical protein
MKLSVKDLAFGAGAVAIDIPSGGARHRQKANSFAVLCFSEIAL